MNRLADVFNIVAAKDDVFGLVSDAPDATHTPVHVNADRYKVERLFADAQVLGKCLAARFRTHAVHPVSLAGVKERLRWPPARFDLPQQCPPDVLILSLYWNPLRQMALEENVVGVVVLRLHAGLGVTIQRGHEREAEGQEDESQDCHSEEALLEWKNKTSFNTFLILCLS